MLRKVIKYTDYNNVEREEAFYFNLNKAEITEMELTQDGGFVEYINKIVAAKDSKAIVETFKKLILKAYGLKSDDGKRFIKSEEISAAFEQTEAYSELFMELATSNEAAANFINAIVPAPPQEISPENRK